MILFFLCCFTTLNAASFNVASKHFLHPFASSTSQCLLKKAKVVPSETHFLPLSQFKQINKRFIALDIEATGNRKNEKDKITEIGCVEIIDDKVTPYYYHVYLNPEKEVSSGAYHLTGLTLSFLKKFPLFKDVKKEFVNFIDGATLVIHDARLEQKLLLQEFQDAGDDYDIEKKHPIIDTYLLAKKEDKTQKCNLNSLAERYNVCTKMRVKHGALIDAKILANVFVKMKEKNPHLFEESLVKLQQSTFLKTMPHLVPMDETFGHDYFKSFGIQTSMPAFFFFSTTLYNPILKKSYSAMVIPFWNTFQKCGGIYARYFIENGESQKSSRVFFGSSFGVSTIILEQNSHKLIIGRVPFSLIAKDILSDRTFLNKDLEDSSIHACFDLKDILSLYFPINLTQLIVLAESKEDIETIEKLKENLKKRNLPLLTGVKKYLNLKNFIVSYQNKIWTITHDEKLMDKRHITLTRSVLEEIKIIITEKNEIIVNTKKITNAENFHLILPQINVSYILPELKGQTTLTVYQQKKDIIVHSFCNVRNDLDCSVYAPVIVDPLPLVTCKKENTHVLSLYQKAFPINGFAPIAIYFRAFGITDFPDDFMCIPTDMHPLGEKESSSLVVPMYKKSKITGLVKFYCNEFGDTFDETYRGELLSPYWKMGDIEGATSLIYKNEQGFSSKKAVVLLMDDLENALIFSKVLKNRDIKIFPQYQTLSIFYIFEEGNLPTEFSTSEIFVVSSNRNLHEKAKKTYKERGIFSRSIYTTTLTGGKIAFRDYCKEESCMKEMPIYKLISDLFQKLD